jgi:hypothetical protein
MALLAVHHLDPVVGIDVHTVIIPPSPSPIPLPHPHVGFVLDFREYIDAVLGVIGSIVFTFAKEAAIDYLEDNPNVAEKLAKTADKVMGKVGDVAQAIADNPLGSKAVEAATKALEISGDLGAGVGMGGAFEVKGFQPTRPVFLNGVFLRASAGTHTYHFPGLHFPLGTGFGPPDIPPRPSSDAESFMGSKTVLASKDPMSYMALPALSCWFTGMEPMKHSGAHTTRTYLSLPTSVMLPIPSGRPVLVGGPPIFNMIAVAKPLFKALFKAFRESGAATALADKLHLKPCGEGWSGKFRHFLTGDPVNPINGEVVVERHDFTIEGRLPLVWDRFYGSQNLPDAATGVGWQCPADIRLELLAHHGRVGVAAYFTSYSTPFDTLPTSPGWENRVYDNECGHALYLLADQLVLRTSESIEYRYRLPADWSERLAAIPSATGPANQDAPALTLLLTGLSDLNGNAWHFERNARQTLTRVVEYSANAPTGRAVMCESGDAPGKLGRLTLTDAQGQSHPLVRYRQDQHGDLIAVDDALDRPYGFKYAAGHLLVRHTHRNG